jgi:putative DNA methylase
MPLALKNLQHGNIAPVDLAQAAIGPGMAIFSRYSKVLEATGQPMPVRTALQIINQELDAYLSAQEGEMDSDTRFCLAWFEQFGLNEAPYGEADVLARAKDTGINALEEQGILAAGKGKVRLLKREELKPDWQPISGQRGSDWLYTQQIVRCLETNGEAGAAELAYAIGSDYLEAVRNLAYRLYVIAERKGWAEEAFAYNSLVVSWPAIEARAAQIRTNTKTQGTMF